MNLKATVTWTIQRVSSFLIKCWLPIKGVPIKATTVEEASQSIPSLESFPYCQIPTYVCQRIPTILKKGIYCHKYASFTLHGLDFSPVLQSAWASLLHECRIMLISICFQFYDLYFPCYLVLIYDHSIHDLFHLCCDLSHPAIYGLDLWSQPFLCCIEHTYTTSLFLFLQWTLYVQHNPVHLLIRHRWQNHILTSICFDCSNFCVFFLGILCKFLYYVC